MYSVTACFIQCKSKRIRSSVVGLFENSADLRGRFRSFLAEPSETNVDYGKGPRPTRLLAFEFRLSLISSISGRI